MKLRLRSLESNETRRIDVPDTCTIQYLKEILIRILSASSSSSSSFSIAALRLSLNRVNELQGSSPEVPLLSVGVISGDLIFYTFNPSGFSSRKATPIEASPWHVRGAFLQGSCPPQSLVVPNAPEKHILVSDCNVKRPKLENCDAANKREQNCESDSEKMDIDDESTKVLVKKCSKPTFLRRVLKEKLGYDRNAHKLLVTAVHAVLLESGFVLIDPNSDANDHPFHIPDDWPSPSFTMSLWYTVPELLGKGGKRCYMIGIVLLRFQSLGHFVNVYGSLGCSRGSCVYRVSLDGKKFGPNLDLIWANSVSSYITDDTEGFLQRQVFEFWKVVKDALALPLLIDLCEKTGLPPPASFMRLPAELKLKILEALCGVDIGILECVCTELRYLASSNDLWKLKFNQEFGCKEVSEGNSDWKARYIACLEDKKLINRQISRCRRGLSLRRQTVISGWLPLPFGNPHPHVIGEDHDLGPGLSLGLLSTFGLPGQGCSRVPRRNCFLPNCDFGRT